jgi:hypothetical protein
MAPPAPGRLSTITGRAQASLRRWAPMRAMMSLPPPGGDGTITRMGREG